jgi:glycosyltransferase involved in cell wall biosynthesis
MRDEKLMLMDRDAGLAPSRPSQAESREARAVKRVVINGRFLGQPLSGVQRYAGEILRALDALLANGAAPWLEVECLLPPGAQLPTGLRAIRVRAIGMRRGHVWEQIDLAWEAAGAILVNLTNSAPVLHGRQIVTIHDASVLAIPENFTWAYRAWYRALYALLRRGPARFATVSSFSAQEISRCFGIDRARIRIIHNAVEHLAQVTPDPAVIGRFGLKPHGYVLAVGGRSRRKNLKAVEDALRLVEGPPPLVLVGETDRRVFAGDGTDPALRRTIEVGRISDGEMKALFQNALCLVFPSLYEGFGLPPLEAMICGCPAIVSATTSLPEVCAQGAFYCLPDEPETIAQHLRALRQDAGLRRRMVALGLARVARFSWEKSARDLLALILEEIAA